MLTLRRERRSGSKVFRRGFVHVPGTEAAEEGLEARAFFFLQQALRFVDTGAAVDGVQGLGDVADSRDGGGIELHGVLLHDSEQSRDEPGVEERPIAAHGKDEVMRRGGKAGMDAAKRALAGYGVADPAAVVR